MICRSCGHIYFRKNAQGVCQDCYTNHKRKEKMFYSVKEWKRFSWEIKEKLSEQYEVFLTDHKTLKEKVKGIFKRSDSAKRKQRRQKLTKVFKKIGKAMTDGSGSAKMSKLSKALNDSNHNVGGLNSKRREPKFTRKQARHEENFDGLMGRNTKQDYSALIPKRRAPKF